MKIFKWIGYLVLLIIIIGGGYIAWFALFHKEVPRTKPNVNAQMLGETSMTQSTFTNAWGDVLDVENGTIVVPENRTQQESNQISVSFIRIPSANPSPGAPIFFLAGGPGTPASSVFRRDFFYVFKKLSEQADVLLIDQRGTGHSIPNLRCRNTMAMPAETSEDWEKDILDDILEKCKECADEFRNMGIDLGGYNSSESAIDIDEIREALHMDKITLFGYSYGTGLAQIYTSMFEAHVDQLILAGPTAPDLDLKLPSELETQYQLMDSLIAQDPKMSNYIPSFTQLMKDQHHALKQEPINLKLPLMDAVNEGDGFVPTTIFRLISLFKPYWKLTLSETHMKVMMTQNSGRSGWTTIAPRYYYQLSQGEHNRLGNYLRNFRRQPMPNAIFFTVSSATNYTQERWELASRDRDDGLVSHFDVSFGRFPEVFEVFGVSQIPDLNRPVYSDVDALLIGGTLDGRTPMSNLDSIYNRFPNAHKIIVHNGSHDDLVNHQVLELITRFIKQDSLGAIEIQLPFTFIPPVAYKYNIVDTLESIRNSTGIELALEKFDKIRDEYLEQDDYYFEVGESSLNNYGYWLMAHNLTYDAEKVLRHNVKLFPSSFNVYNSLAEAQIANGNIDNAVRSLQKAVELNSLDGYSHGLLKRYQ